MEAVVNSEALKLAAPSQNRSRSSRAAPAGSFWPMLQAVRASTKCWQSVVSTL
jgi:hypothetical protein